MLHDDQGVAHVAQPDQGLDQAVVVPLVEADGRLVEHVEHADQTGTDLGGQADALGLAAGERPGGAVEREVVQADVDQEAEPLVDLLEDALGDLLLAAGQLEPGQEVGALADGQGGDLGDRLPVHRDRQDDRLQAGALAGGAGHLAHVALEALPAVVRLGVLVAALDERDGALEGRGVPAFTAVPVAVADVDLGLVAVQQRLPGAGGQAGEGDVGAEAQRVGERVDEAAEVLLGVPGGPRVDGALLERLLRVRDDQLGVDLHARADAGAVGAGAEGRVEGEGARLQLLEGEVVVRAVQVLREHALALGVVGREVDEVQHDHAAGEAERGLHGVREAALGGALHREAVHDHLDGVLLLLLQLGRVGELDRRAVHPGAAVALGLQVGEEVDELPLALAHQRGEHLEPAALRQFEDPVHDGLRRLAGDRAPALGTVRLADPREQQAEVVVHLGDGADRRARVARGRLLVDGDRRGEALDEVHVRLVHLAEELPGVRGERLHVAALALGEDRVEGEGRLARTRQTREDDERVTRQVERDVLQVVLARATDDETVGHAVPHLSWGEMTGAGPPSFSA
ncbi:hypothetical protein M2169_004488 [Streptomyces sp. MJP52]|nr:hypothetical protein [Streptomyces sp. MJP52]